MTRSRRGGELAERPEVPLLATREDATASLKTIAVAEAGEKFFERAATSQSDPLQRKEDVEQLFKAGKTKLEHQAAYVVWRQDEVVPSQRDPKLRGKRAGISERKFPLPDGDPGDFLVYKWRKRLCDKTEGRWVVDLGKLQQVLDDSHERCVRIYEQQNANTIRGTEGTGEFERYTPPEHIAAVREVLGEIDLDPASSALAQETVQALGYFTEADDGLKQEWVGRVFLNPPYHRELAPAFITKLLEEIAAGRTTEAVVLTNNSTDTTWFNNAARRCQCICFTTGRIHFTVPDREPVLPTQGQAFFYFGANRDRFHEVFDKLGWCTVPL